MWARAFTTLIWAAAAATAVYWGLKLYGAGTPPPPHVRALSSAPGANAWQNADLARLLGADEVVPPPVAEAPAPAAADARYQLLGVVAPRGNAGAAPAVALIAVDGKLPRAYRVGAVVSGETVLRAVHARSADLGQREGPVAATLRLAPAAGMPAAGAPRPLAAPAAVPMRPGVMPGFTPQPPGLMQVPGGVPPARVFVPPTPVVPAPPQRLPHLQSPQPQAVEAVQGDAGPAPSVPPEATPPSQRRRMGSSEATR
jgi:general secretion pathway protein C